LIHCDLEDLTDEMIKDQAYTYAKALELDIIKRPSNGWVQSFKQRHVFSWRKIHGESGDAQMQNIEEKLVHIRERIAAYTLKDIFNFDETALQPSLAPDATIARYQIEGKTS
jgi:hypothetical protein